MALASLPSDMELAEMLHRVVHSSSDIILSPFNIVHNADVYAADPAELTRRYPPVVAVDGNKAWYFFTELVLKNPQGNRKKRSTDSGDGVWHNEGKEKVVSSDEGWHRSLFSFKRKGPDGKLARSGWIMFEFGLQPRQGISSSLVLCKVMQTRPTSSTDRIESSSSTSSAHVVAVGTVEAAMAAAKVMEDKICAVKEVLSSSSRSRVTEMETLVAAEARVKTVVETVRRATAAARKTVERVHAVLKAAAVEVCLSVMGEVAMASNKASALAMSAMTVTEGADLTKWFEAARAAAKATVKCFMAFEEYQDKVAVLMAAEGAAEAAAEAASVMVQAAATIKPGNSNVLLATLVAAAEAGKTVEATATALVTVASQRLEIRVDDIWR